MTRAELVAHFVATTSLTRQQVETLLAELVELATREVLEGREFIVPGLGKLVHSQRPARTGRNPSTGQPMAIPARSALKFRVSKAIKSSTLGGGNTTDSDI